ncbi:MAG: xanthine dehydrogenase family protein molybdopterin-binding subunit [Sulfolobales archaeon]
MIRYVGKPLKTFEAGRFIRGAGIYVDDIKIPGTLYLKIIRSPYPRALVRGIELGSIKPILMLTWRDIDENLRVRVDPEISGIAKIVPMPILARDRVNFVGQPVAAIVASDPYEAEDIAEQVYVNYEPLDSVADPEEAIKPEAPQIHEGVERNTCLEKRFVGGDPSVFREADGEVEVEIDTERIVANPMETKGALAIYESGKLTIYATTQNPYRVRDELSSILKIPINNIRVISPDVGGGFGVKVPLHAEYVLTAYASMILKKPVKWIETRREHLLAPYQGRGVRARIKGYFKKDGKILGISGKVIVDLGAYNFSINQNIAVNIVRWITGPYDMKAVDIDLLAVFTNKTPFNAYRGAGRPEAALIYERVMDAAADELGIDRGEIRMINVLKGYGEYKNPLGVVIDVANYLETYMRAHEEYERLKREISKTCPEGMLCGAGISNYIEFNRASPGEKAKIRIRNKSIEIAVGTHSHGQGHATTFAQLAADELGLPIERIRIVYGDTEELEWGEGTSGSRGMVAGGAAVVKACRALLEKISSMGYSIEEALEKLEGIEVEAFAEGYNIFSYGSHIAAVAIDPETGHIKVIRYIAVDDVGRAINPAVIEGQIVGGVIQGAGQVLWEAARYDEKGYPLFTTILDTGVPSALEAFNIESIFVENPSRYPHGARGIGEAGAIGAPPAIVSAIENALARVKKIRIKRLPVTPETILNALSDK